MEVVRLIEDGQSQSVRLPEDYHFEGGTVYLKRVGNAVVLIPEHESWQLLVDSLPLFSDDFMSERDQPAERDQAQMFE